MRKHQQNSFAWLSTSLHAAKRVAVVPWILAAVLTFALSLQAQQDQRPAASAPSPGIPSSAHIGNVPDDSDDIDTPADFVPRVGFNAAVIFNGAHDSESGWSTMAMPYISYTFGKNFSTDLSCPIYFFRNAENTLITPPKASAPPTPLLTRRGETGDTLLAIHAAFSNHYFDYMGTLSATGPSGDTTYGLSTGRVTFDLTHDFAHSFGRFGPGAELGVGDSNTFANTKVVRDYISLGPLAHFQLGSTVDLPLHALFEADAYEELPIGDQKIYTTVVLRHHTTTEIAGTGVSEDNGYTAQLDFPLRDQIIVSGFYNRSRRFSIDTAGISLTFLLRSPRMLSREAREQKQLDDLMK